MILTSGYSEDLLREEDGFAGFIQKPYRIEELSTRLAHIIAKCATPAEDAAQGAADGTDSPEGAAPRE